MVLSLERARMPIAQSKPFFFEKKNQKLSFIQSMGVVGVIAHGRNSQTFFASFFQKRRAGLP
jgi:hypothetical protein